jgi:hypothetical protein
MKPQKQSLADLRKDYECQLFMGEVSTPDFKLWMKNNKKKAL